MDYGWFWSSISCYSQKHAIPRKRIVDHPLRGSKPRFRNHGIPKLPLRRPFGEIPDILVTQKSQPAEWLNSSYPLVMTNIAIENGHRNSGFSHWKWWFSIAMLVYQRVILKVIGPFKKHVQWLALPLLSAICFFISSEGLKPLASQESMRKTSKKASWKYVSTSIIGGQQK